jgi:hypothetical protein
VDADAGLPDLKFAEARLLRNQADIGNAIKPYYGAAAGNRLTKLLRTHILEAVPVLVNAKAGNKPKLTRALDAWYANAHEIAGFLSKANPDAWPLDMTSSMMKRHLQLTTAEAVARLQGHWGADIAAYDKVHPRYSRCPACCPAASSASFRSASKTFDLRAPISGPARHQPRRPRMHDAFPRKAMTVSAAGSPVPALRTVADRRYAGRPRRSRCR